MKPIYIIGHNPNTIKDVHDYLKLGANAIEPDINIISNTTNLCVNHDEGNANTISLDDYLKQLNQLLEMYPNFSLIYLDCKPTVIGMGIEILHSIRINLDPKIKVVFSVATVEEAKVMFPPIVHDLRTNEYLLIDEENDPELVANFFRTIGAIKFGYGNGDSVPLLPTDVFFPHIRESISKACELRKEQRLGFVFTWTFNSKLNQNSFLSAGVDGVIVDLNGFPCLPGLFNIQDIIRSGNVYKEADRNDELCAKL